MTSPSCTPATAAGLSGSTPSTITPSPSFNPRRLRSSGCGSRKASPHLLFWTMGSSATASCSASLETVTSSVLVFPFRITSTGTVFPTGVAASHAALGFQFRQELFGQVDGNGKPNPDVPPSLTEYGAVDADDFPLLVKQ